MAHQDSELSFVLIVFYLRKKNSFRKWSQNVDVKKKEPDFFTPKNGYCNNKIIIEMKLQVTTHKIELHCEALK